MNNIPPQFEPRPDEDAAMMHPQATSESPTDVDAAAVTISPEEQYQYDRFFEEATFDDIKEIADILGIAYQVVTLLVMYSDMPHTIKMVT